MTAVECNGCCALSSKLGIRYDMPKFALSDTFRYLVVLEFGWSLGGLVMSAEDNFQ